MRAGRFTMTRIACAVGFVAVAGAIAATVVFVRHDDGVTPGVVSAALTPSDALARELAGCQALGLAARDDTACAAAWAETRRRFFTYSNPSDDAVAPLVGQTPEHR